MGAAGEGFSWGGGDARLRAPSSWSQNVHTRAGAALVGFFRFLAGPRNFRASVDMAFDLGGSRA